MNVILYSTGCPRCSMIKRVLDSKKVEYTEINDIDKMTELGFTTVPMLDVDGDVMSYAKATKFLMEEM